VYINRLYNSARLVVAKKCNKSRRYISWYLGALFLPRDDVLDVDFAVGRISDLAFEYSVRTDGSGDSRRTAHH